MIDITALLIAERDRLNRAIEALGGTTLKRQGRPPLDPLKRIAWENASNGAEPKRRGRPKKTVIVEPAEPPPDTIPVEPVALPNKPKKRAKWGSKQKKEAHRLAQSERMKERWRIIRAAQAPQAE